MNPTGILALLATGITGGGIALTLIWHEIKIHRARKKGKDE